MPGLIDINLNFTLPDACFHTGDAKCYQGALPTLSDFPSKACPGAKALSQTMQQGAEAYPALPRAHVHGWDQIHNNETHLLRPTVHFFLITA